MTNHKYPIDAIKFPKKFPNGYTRNPNATGLCIENLGLKNKNKYILSEWQREPSKSVWGHDKSVCEYIDNPNKKVKTCKSIIIELKNTYPNIKTSNPHNKSVCRCSLPKFSNVDLDNGRRLVYIPDTKFKLYIGWYHRIDEEINSDTYQRMIPDPIEYEKKWNRNHKCALNSVKDAISRIHNICGNETIYLMQLERWRKHNNPV